MKAKESRPPGSLQRLVRPLDECRLSDFIRWRRRWSNEQHHDEAGDGLRGEVDGPDGGHVEEPPKMPPQLVAGRMPSEARGLRRVVVNVGTCETTLYQQVALTLKVVFGFLFSHTRVPRPNDPSSATRPAGRVDCNRSARAGFAAAHG